MTCPTIQPFCIMPPGPKSITNVLFESDTQTFNYEYFSMPPYSFVSEAEVFAGNQDNCGSERITNEWVGVGYSYPPQPPPLDFKSTKSINGEVGQSTGYSSANMGNHSSTELNYFQHCPESSSTDGVRNVCAFKGFKGNPVQCCLQNMFCDTPETGMYLENYPGVFNQNCFTHNSDGTVSSCDFQYRRLGDGGYCYADNVTPCDSCYNQMFAWCTNPSEANTVMPQKWTSEYTVNSFPTPISFQAPCAQFMLSTMYSNAPFTDRTNIECPSQSILEYLNPNTAPFPIPNPSMFDAAKKVFTTAVTRYVQGGGVLDTATPQEGSDIVFNDFVYQVCDKYPAMCTEILTQYCSDKTPDDLTRNPVTMSFCGCYLNPTVYEDIEGKFGINQECSPYCASEGVLQLSDETYTGKKGCNQTVCLIEDISIDLIQSRVTGAINLGNLCGGCATQGAVASSNCSCVLNNITVTAVNSDINTINLQQECSSIVCYKTVNNQKIQVDCNTGEIIETETEKVEKEGRLIHNLKMLGLILLFIALVIIFVWLISPNTSVPIPVKMHYPPSEPGVFDRPYTSILTRK